MSFFLKSRVPISVFLIIFLLIVIAGLLNFFLNKPPSFYENKELAINNCIQECNQAQALDQIPFEGKCLSEEIVSGWACNITNSKQIDFIKKRSNNQCTNYKKRKVKNIVTLSKSCEVVFSS